MPPALSQDGLRLSNPIIEFCYKDDSLGDPIVNEDHITTLGWATAQELDDIVNYTIHINLFLRGLFFGVGIILVDFKLEFGRLYENDDVTIVLADEISPDSCRLWDSSTHEKMDKDRFRKNMGGLVEAYSEVATRLGILNGNASKPRKSGPFLVSDNGKSRD